MGKANVETIQMFHKYMRKCALDTSVFLYVESKKMIQMNLFTKQKQTHRQQTYSYQRGKVRGG